MIVRGRASSRAPEAGRGRRIRKTRTRALPSSEQHPEAHTGYIGSAEEVALEEQLKVEGG